MNLKQCLLYLLVAAMGVAANGNEIKPDLIKDLIDIFELIPAATRDEIIAKHLLTDLKCIKAFKFLESQEFKQLLQEATNLKEISDILIFLHALTDSNNDTKKRVNDVDYLQHFNMEYIIMDVPARPHKVEMGFEAITATENPAAESHNLHDFISFINDLLQHFPRDKFVQLVKDKRAKSVNFDTSYKAARSRDLRPKVEEALKMPNVKKILQKFNAHYINVNSLVPIAFEVLSWGPPAIEQSTFKYTLFV